MAVTVAKYNVVSRELLAALINCNDAGANAFRASLHTSSYVFDAAHDDFVDLTNELATANGYVAGGLGLTGVVLSLAVAIAKFDANDTIWTASGGTIGPARHCIVRHVASDTPLLDVDFGQNESATIGNTFSIIWSANGLIRLGV